MTGYVFIFGDGDYMYPAIEEGCYLDFQKAFNHLVKLNTDCIKNSNLVFYEDGYDENCCPESDVVMYEAYKSGNWELFDELLESHILTDVTEICKQLVFSDITCYPFIYTMQKIEII